MSRHNPVTRRKLGSPVKLGRRASTTENQLRSKFGMVAQDSLPLIAYLGLDKPTTFLGRGSSALVWVDARDKDRVVKITRDPMDGNALAYLASIQLEHPELLMVSPRVFKVNVLNLSEIDEEVDTDEFQPTEKVWAVTMEKLTNLFDWEKKLRKSRKKSWADAVYVAWNVLYKIFEEDSIAGISARYMTEGGLAAIEGIRHIDKRSIVFREMIDNLPKIARSMVEEAGCWVEDYIVDNTLLAASADQELAVAILKKAGQSLLTLMKYGIYVPDIAGRNWGVRLGPEPLDFEIMLFDFGLSAGGGERDLNMEVLETQT